MGLETQQTAGEIGDSWTDIFVESQTPLSVAEFDAATDILLAEDVVARDAVADKGYKP